MARTHSQVLRKHLTQLADVRACTDDADALRRHRAGDPDAFPDLVHRHGPMVYGVCRRILGPTPDADDAFQAVFLALVRKPASVRNADALPAWLHRVALRTARKAMARRKPVHPTDEATASRDPGPADRAAWADVRRALDEELNGLPESLRSALVLCYLDGATRDEAARRLEWTVATLDRRLAAGRARLRDRLARRGLGTVALGTAVFADGLRAAVPIHLAQATTALAPAGNSASAAVRALAVGRLAVGVPMATAVLILGGLTVTLIGAAGRPAGEEPPRPQPPTPVAAKPADPADVPLPDEPLPEGAVARMGSTRFRHAGLRDFTWLPGGKSIATVAFRSVRVWDVETGRRTKAVILNKAWGLFTLSADAKLAATSSPDATTVFDAGTGEVLATLAGNNAWPAQFGFSPDGKLLYLGGGGGQVSVWDWKAGKEYPVPVTPPRWGGTDSSFHCHFSPDGKLFVAGVQSTVPLAVFNVATWEKVRELDCSAATSTFTPDSKQLIVSSHKGNAAGGGGILRVIDIGTGKELHQFTTPGYYFSMAVSPDGKVLGCGASDQSCLFDLTTGKVLHTLTDRPWGLAFSPDGKTLAASAAGTHLRFWDVATGKERHEQPGSFGSPLAAAVSPDGRLLAAADWMDREVHTWDTTTGKRVALFPLKAEGRYTRNLTFSTDGRTLAAGLYQGMVQVWDVKSGKEVRAFQFEREQPLVKGGSTYYYAVQMSADGRWVGTVERVFTQPESTRVTVWDSATGKPLRDRSYPGERRRCAWSADGETLALALDTGVVLIDLDTCEERAGLDGSAPGSVTVAMSPDGRLVATERGDPKKGPQPVGIYEVATGKAVATVPASGDFGIARDNRTLFTADATHIRAWDLATGKELARRTIPDTWMGTQGQATITQIVPLAGRRVFTPMTDGTGLVWDFAPAPTTGVTADEKQLAAWWDNLRADDAAKAYAAVWGMSEVAPDRFVAFLGRHLQPEVAPDAVKMRQLIADLDSNAFRVREQSAKELETLGHAAAPALQKALAAGPSAETARRIEQLLARKPASASRPDELRRLRAMQILERAGTAEARKVLSDLAGGLPLAPETKEAKAALARTSP